MSAVGETTLGKLSETLGDDQRLKISKTEQRMPIYFSISAIILKNQQSLIRS